MRVSKTWEPEAPPSCKGRERTMSKTLRIGLVLLLAGSAYGTARPAEPYVYPDKGRSQQQIEKDK